MTALLVILTAAIWFAAFWFFARGRAAANRPAPPSDPDACWGCETGGYGPGTRHTCGRRAGEWTESRRRGGRP